MKTSDGIIIGTAVIAMAVAWYFIKRPHPTDVQEGVDNTPWKYTNYNVPQIAPLGVPTGVVGLQTATPDNLNAASHDMPAPATGCDSGCGQDNTYANALTNILNNFAQSTADLVGSYQNAILNTLPESTRQYINNDQGYVAARRANAFFANGGAEAMMPEMAPFRFVQAANG